jgi:Icc-related predicted phosphoesterase
MPRCFFCSDIHGRTARYEQLFKLLAEELPDIVLLGGDLLPHGLHRSVHTDFTREYLLPELKRLKEELRDRYPEILVILGNDDPMSEEPVFLEMESLNFWKYIHNRKVMIDGYDFYGYSFVPPTPFRLKDWERYDVSKYVDPGCISPEEGIRTVEPIIDISSATISHDLSSLAGEAGMERAVFLFHSPPYDTHLDRAALDGVMVDHVPMDVHVGSIAIMRFIEKQQPLVTLHGHIHESTRLTGKWSQQFGRTWSFNAAWDGPELSLITFDLQEPANANWRLAGG